MRTRLLQIGGRQEQKEETMLLAVAGPYSTREHEATQQLPTAPLVTKIRMDIAQVLTKIRASEELLEKLPTTVAKCHASRFRKVEKRIIVLCRPCAGRCAVGFDLQGNLYQIYGTALGAFSLERENEYNLRVIAGEVQAIESILSS